jgi:Outer membrane protein (OmpH-like).
MKHVFSLTLLLATPFAFAVTDVKPVAKASSSGIKISYFSASQAVGQSKVGKAVSEEMEKKRLGYEEDFKKDEAAYTKKIKDLQAKASTMSDSAKHAAEESLMKMKRDIENKAKGFDEDLKLAMNQAQEKVSKNLFEAAKKAGQEEGADLLHDVDRDIVINPDKINGFTSKIVAHMDAAYNKSLQPKKPAVK